MNTRKATVLDIDKILYLKEQVFEIHLKAKPDWMEKIH